MNSNLIKALNDQMNMERQNAAIYDALSVALDVVFWDGSSKWMKQSANEEREHADKFAAFIVDRNGTPLFAPLDGCMCPIGDDLVSFFQAALERELATTEALKTLYYQAEETEDPQTCTFLIPFLDEQTRSEREITDILIMLRRLDNNGRLVFDKSLI